MTKFYTFGKTYQLKNVLYTLRECEVPTPIEYVGTVKLHGTNSAIVFTPDGVYAQSRKRVITPESDNYGFARWVAEGGSDKVAKDIGWNSKCTASVVVFGEWVGPGIQDTVAVCQLPERHFVPFSVYYPDTDTWADPSDVFSTPTAPVVGHATLDPNDPVGLVKLQEKILALVLEVEEKCPYAAQFGIEGVGEGIVWSPVDRSLTPAGLSNRDICFKTKGEKHTNSKVTKTKAPALSSEACQGLEDFLDFALSDARMAQGVQVLVDDGLDLVMKNTGTYILWVQNDVKEECSLELASLDELGIQERQVMKMLTKRAAFYYKHKVNN